MFTFSFLRRSRSAPSDPSQPAFPTQQLFVLALCRICEPIAFMSIFPYVYFMIASFNITTDDRQISVYAGMVTSAFAFAEFSSGVLWGRLSDVVGRKPVLLTGLAGTGLSMIVFGFAPSLQVALIARALGGLLNGNIGVIQTTVAEVVKVKEHQPRAYAIMPFVWCLGSIIGSGLGGCLAEPVKNYPNIFAQGTIWAKYPFLLPNIICAFVVLCGLVIGILFLEETHEKLRHRRDRGTELGSWLLQKLTKSQQSGPIYATVDTAVDDESSALMRDSMEADTSIGVSSAETTPRLGPSQRSSFVIADRLDDEITSEKPKQSVRKAFTTQVIFHVVAYGILAFHTISFEQLMPVLLSTKESTTPPSLPFKFEGGYGLPSSKIGFILSLQGVYQMFAQMLVFPFVVRRLGPLRTFRMVAFLWGFLYIAVPYLVLLPDTLRLPGLAVVLMCKVTLQSLSYPSNALLLANSAPSMLVLGAINGVAASAASLCRAFGPTLSGLIQSAGSSIGYSGLAWWVSAVVCAIGAVETLWMIEPPGRDFGPSKEVDSTIELKAARHSSETSFSDSTLVDENSKATTSVRDSGKL